MSITAIIILVTIAIGAVAGLAAGLVKGFSRVKSWGVEYVLACALTIFIMTLIGKKLEGAVAGAVSLGLAIGFLLLFMLISFILRIVFKKCRESRIRNNLKGGGASGVVDRLFGGFTLAVKGAVIMCVVNVAMITAFELIQVSFINKAYADIFSSPIWQFFKPYVFDCFVIGIITLCIRCGYSSGISSVLWTFIVILMVIGVGLIAYHFAFKVQAFNALATALAAKLEGVMGGMSSFLPAETLARIIIMIGLFLAMLVVVILIGIFMPRLINFARESKVFYAIDGVIGAFFATLTALAFLMLVGGVLGSISDLEFMLPFTAFFEKSQLAKYFYTENLFSLLGMLPSIPLRDWLT